MSISICIGCGLCRLLLILLLLLLLPAIVDSSSSMSIRTFFLVAELVIVGAETTTAELTGVGFLTCMYPHVPVPSGSIVQGFSTNWALFPFFGIAHSGRCHFLHVVIQLQVCHSLSLTKINAITTISSSVGAI